MMTRRLDRLVERLRSRRAFGLFGSSWIMSTEPDEDCRQAAHEIENLRLALRLAQDDLKKATQVQNTKKAFLCLCELTGRFHLVYKGETCEICKEECIKELSPTTVVNMLKHINEQLDAMMQGRPT